MSRYRLTVRRHFSAAHHLRDYDGKCAHLHGHNYKIEITVTGDELDDCGMLMDFGQLTEMNLDCFAVRAVDTIDSCSTLHGKRLKYHPVKS